MAKVILDIYLLELQRRAQPDSSSLASLGHDEAATSDLSRSSASDDNELDA